MEKELLQKIYVDRRFKDFCKIIDDMKLKKELTITRLDSAMMLLYCQIDYIKGEENLSFIHELIKEFLNPTGRKVSDNTKFFDYFIIKNLIGIANNNSVQIEKNRYRILPLDITNYAKSLLNIGACTCGYEPKVFLSCFINSLTVHILCEKCGLKVSALLIYEASFTENLGEFYVNLEDGIVKLWKRWNIQIEKNESILHRTMRELLQYDENCCVNELKVKMHDKLYEYMIDNDIYRKPKYWNEEGYWDVATDKMLECKEPKEWIEDYLWENMPNRIGSQEGHEVINYSKEYGKG